MQIPYLPNETKLSKQVSSVCSYFHTFYICVVWEGNAPVILTTNA